MSQDIVKKDENLEVDEIMEENEASISYDIAAYPSDLTLSVVYEMWKDGDIIIPNFQRNFVWSIKQSSKLIESFLLGLPVPQIFFYVDKDGKSQVIDGQQRIMSIVYFFEGYFGSENYQGKKYVFRLQGLHEESPFSKKNFEGLDDASQRKFKSSVLRAINIRQLNPQGEATSIYHIFERLNTGGTPLTPQEIRNCVFRGDFINILRNLNEDISWRKILGKTTYDIHQKDIELILRIFGITYYYTRYEKPMKEFLNKVMLNEKLGMSQHVKRFEIDFPKVAKLIIDSLGNKPFHLRGPLNTSVLDSVFSTLLLSPIQQINLRENYEKLCKDQEFVDTTSYNTSDTGVVKKRIETVKRHLIG